MPSLKSFALILFIIMTLFMSGCDNDSSTNAPGPGQGSLLLSKLVVGMVPYRSEEVKINSIDANGAYSPCQVSSTNPLVASASLIDSTLYITGLTNGVTNITVTNGAEKSRILPVQVYDPQILDTGEMLITFTDDFDHIFTHSNPGLPSASFWKPRPPEGFYAFGSYARADASNPNGMDAVMCIKPKEGSDAVVIVTSFDSYYGQLHTPQAPPGYKAMGHTLTLQNQTPAPVACIREDLTVAGMPGDRVYAFTNNQTHDSESAWRVAPPDVFNPHEEAYLAPGTFIFNLYLDPPPSNHALLNVLRVDLPMLAEASMQEFYPRLASYDNPPEETAPRMAKAMLVPCTVIRDIVPGHQIAWQVANSPYYRLEREVYYKNLYWYYNQGSVVANNSVELRSGISTDSSSTIWNETQVQLSLEAGLNFKALSGKLTATVSQKFGYETQVTITELSERTDIQAVSTPPGKATALWQQYSRFKLYRHNGTDLELVRTWSVGIHGYVLDEYPDQ